MSDVLSMEEQLIRKIEALEKKLKYARSEIEVLGKLIAEERTRRMQLEKKYGEKEEWT